MPSPCNNNNNNCLLNVSSGLRPLRGSVKEREHKKFIMYSVYALGCPFIIFIISVVMQFGDIPDDFIKPNFGEDKCWFKGMVIACTYFKMLYIICCTCLTEGEEEREFSKYNNVIQIIKIINIL